MQSTLITTCCHEAFTINKILENIMQHLNPCDRLGGAALVSRQFQVAAAHVTATEGIHEWFDRDRDEAEGVEARDDKVVRWLNKHGHKVSCMVIHDGNWFRGDLHPFMSMLTSITSLEFCCMGGKVETWSCVAQSLKVSLSVPVLSWGIVYII